MNNISFFTALGFGLLSFFSPCILPLIPAYLSFITGISVDKLQESESAAGVSKNLWKFLGETLLFILGFSFVFISLGASATMLGNFIFENRRLINIIGGIIIIIFGLQVAGVFNIKYLQYERRFHLKSKPVHKLGSFVIGFVFALGWTPCIGPILGSILTLASTKETVSQGIMLLSFYSIGLAIPFIFTSIFIGWVLGSFSKIKKHFRLISALAGILLIFIGIGITTGILHF